MITLKTLPEATAQEVFDQVAKHLIKQNVKAQITDEQEIKECVYRSGTLTCAAGCLIGDNEYNEEVMERNGWGGLVTRSVVPSNHDDLISELQEVHDHEAVITWKEELIKVAIAHDLDYSFLNN